MIIRGYDARGLAYMRACLVNGNTLSKKLLGSIQDGTIASLLPADLPERRRYDFQVGGVTEQKKTTAELAQFVSSFLTSTSNGHAIVENREMATNSRFLTDLPHAIFGNEIYLVLNNSDLMRPDVIDRVLKAGTRYPFIMALVSGSAVKSSFPVAKISLQVLEEWANGITYVVVGVYDEETYLIWSASLSDPGFPI